MLVFVHPFPSPQHVAKHCPALRVLDLSECKQITDETLISIAHSCPYIEVTPRLGMLIVVSPSRRVCVARPAFELGQRHQDHRHEHRPCCPELSEPQGARALGMLQSDRRWCVAVWFQRSFLPSRLDPPWCSQQG